MPSSKQKPCKVCKNIIERTDVPHVLRKCSACGRDLHIHEPGEHGIGFKIRQGDIPIIPINFLKTAFNPLKSSTKLTLDGLNWFAKLIFFEEFPQRDKQISTELLRLEEKCNQKLGNSQLLHDLNLDISNSEHAQQIFENLQNKSCVEWWYFSLAMFISIVQEALEEDDAEKAAWGMAGVERCRAITIFKEHLEEVVWMGHSAKRVIDFLAVWDGNKSNSDEGFWQIQFTENTYALSQIFAYPLIFIKEQAYVGGMNIDRQAAKFIDYIFASEASQEVVLIEIKTPTTKLLGSKYRNGIYKPSAELTGALVQALDYKNKIIANLENLKKGTKHLITAINPKCIVIAGDGSTELNSEDKRRSFELFRANSRDVELVTYDELFKKLEILAGLFSLKRTAN